MANRVPKDGKLRANSCPFTIRFVTFWKSNKNQRNNNSNERAMKYKKTENNTSLIIRIFRLLDNLDFAVKTVIKKIKNYIIRKSCEI